VGVIRKFLDEYGQIAIPVEVELEITVGETFDSKLLRKEIDDSHIKVMKIKSNTDEIMKEFRIHKGEASAYMLFHECKAKVILTDDGELIKLCKLFRIPFINALSIIVRMYAVALSIYSRSSFIKMYDWRLTQQLFDFGFKRL
jgi:predicted nucleic acid-binding protein